MGSRRVPALIRRAPRACRLAFWKRCRLGGAPSLKAAAPWPYSKDQLPASAVEAPRSVWRGMADEPSAPSRQQASCCLLFRACNGRGRATARQRAQHVASSAALHGTTRLLPHCHIHRCHSPFDPPSVCLTCHWLTGLWILWVPA